MIPIKAPQAAGAYHLTLSAERYFTKDAGKWGKATADAHRETCPACHRTHDHFSAGFLTLQGAFFLAHREEVMHLVHNVEKRERAKHPLKRIMAIEEKNEATLATTTDIHFVRGIGEALHHACQDDLAFHHKPCAGVSVTRGCAKHSGSGLHGPESIGGHIPGFAGYPDGRHAHAMWHVIFNHIGGHHACRRNL